MGGMGSFILGLVVGWLACKLLASPSTAKSSIPGRTATDSINQAGEVAANAAASAVGAAASVADKAASKAAQAAANIADQATSAAANAAQAVESTAKKAADAVETGAQKAAASVGAAASKMGATHSSEIDSLSSALYSARQTLGERDGEIRRMNSEVDAAKRHCTAADHQSANHASTISGLRSEVADLAARLKAAQEASDNTAGT